MPFLMAFLLQSSPASTSVSLFRGSALPRAMSAAGAIGAAQLPSYQDVEDTTLDASDSKAANGGNFTLEGGPGRTILIRFGDLENTLPYGAKITSASLILTSSGGPVAPANRVATVKSEWGEGPGIILNLTGVLRKATDDDRATTTPLGAASWRDSRAGLSGGAWVKAGADSDADSTPVAGFSSTADGPKTFINGLASTVQSWIDQPLTNHGLSLSFGEACDYQSSESPLNPPTLELTYEVPKDPAPLGAAGVIGSAFDGQVLTIQTQGLSGADAAWTTDGNPQSQSVGKIAADGTLKIAVTTGSLATPSRNRIDLTVGKFSTTVFPWGTPVNLVAPANVAMNGAWIDREFDEANRVFLQRSRYSFSADGCKERIRLAQISSAAPSSGISYSISGQGQGPEIDYNLVRGLLLAIGTPNLGESDPKEVTGIDGYYGGGESWFPDITGGGDTRYEGGLPPSLSFSQDATYSPFLSSVPVKASGLISATGVGVLNSLVGLAGDSRATMRQKAILTFPDTVLVRSRDALGNPLSGVEFQVFQLSGGKVAPDPVESIVTDEKGVAILPNRALPAAVGLVAKNPFASADLEANGALLVRAVRNGVTAWNWLKWWQLADAAFRGNAGVAVVDLSFDLPAAPIASDQNLALNKLVSIAGDTDPNVSGLTSGTPVSIALPEAKQSAVEVDLNRDRTIGEVDLEVPASAMWKEFKIETYNTGQSAADASIWARELDSRWSMKNRGMKLPNGNYLLRYFGPAVPVRFLRIVQTGSGPGSLAQITVFATKILN